jgi:hypothetical protein
MSNLGFEPEYVSFITMNLTSWAKHTLQLGSDFKWTLKSQEEAPIVKALPNPP